MARELILRPNGAGFYTELTVFGAAANWQAVNEVVLDTGKYVSFWNFGWTTDTYALEDHTYQRGRILGVTVNSVDKCNVAEAAKGRLVLRLGGVDVTGTEYDLVPGVWSPYTELLARPGGGLWTWADIDALEAGWSESSATWKAGYLAQLWVAVSYEPPACGGNASKLVDSGLI